MPKKQKSDDGRLFSSDVCAFCGLSEDNELLYGKFLQGNGTAVHSNCLFFSSGLSQSDNENEEFLGFLLPDIEQELLRGKKLNCAYCRKRGATIGCVELKCKKSFHLPCGLKHNTLHQFFGCFNSFCKSHSPKQQVQKILDDSSCHICFDKIESDQYDSCLYSPCCKNSWFHKICMQKYALSAGLYFFKCPLCKNSEEFVKEMKILGICIPDKDASWELEENAYQDLLTRPECNAEVCLCKKGRKYNASKNSAWKLISCSHCGFHARHKACEKVKLSVRTFVCHDCLNVDERMNQKKVSSKPDGYLGKRQAQLDAAYAAANRNREFSINLIIYDSPRLSSDFEQKHMCQNHRGKLFSSETSSAIVTSSAGTSDSNILKVENSDNFKRQSPIFSNEISKAQTTILNFENSKNVELFTDENSTTSLSDSGLELEIIPSEFSGIKNESYELRSCTKQADNERNIKNISPDIVNCISKLRSPVQPPVKAPIKKVKRHIEHICSEDKNCCIKKYFKQENGKFRL